MPKDGEFCSLLPPLEVHTIDNSTLHSFMEQRLEELQHKVKYEGKNGNKPRGSYKLLKFFLFFVILTLLNVQKP